MRLLREVRQIPRTRADEFLCICPVDRNLSPFDIFCKTGGIPLRASEERILANNWPLIHKPTMDYMPRGEGNEARVVYFRIRHFVTQLELEAEYTRRNLRPTDPYSLCAVNSWGRLGMGTLRTPNATIWNDMRGPCFLAIESHVGERKLSLGRSDYGWNSFWYFGGIEM